MVNLSSFIRFHAQRMPDSTAVTFEGIRISYASLYARIEKVGGWLLQSEIGPGDVVAVMMKNSTAFLELAFATSHVGAVFLPINYRLSTDEVSYILGNAGARILVADDEFRPVLKEQKTTTLYLDKTLQANLSILGAGIPAASKAVDREVGDAFRLMYTSGTTDRPKGVIHTYDNFYWKCMDQVVALGLSAETRLYVGGPLYHVGAFDLPGVAVLWTGGMLSLHRDFDAASTLASIQDEALTGAWLAPVMSAALLACTRREEFDVSSLRWVIGGGERTPEARIRNFSEYFTNARYIDAYGLTESCSGDTMMEAGREIEKIGSVGRPLAHVQLSIRDDEGRRLSAGVEGEICLKGPKITRGYWNDPAKTAAAFHRSWFRTGDVGYLDDEGFLFITDRKKDMIISGGENIASSEVERVLYQLSEILEVAVIGVPDPKWGERPVAIIVLVDGASLSLETVVGHCRSRLAAFKAPKAIFLRPSLPRNPSGKVLKRVLRESVMEQLTSTDSATT